MTGSCDCSSGSRRSLYLTGSCSVLSCLGVLLPSLYCLVRADAWSQLREWVNSWLVRNHWDVEVTQSVWRSLDWLDLHHGYFLGALVASSATHLLSALLLLLAAMLRKRGLLLPWLITDLVVMGSLVVIFLSWTFISFFVDLLIAIVFPAVAGMLIGVWILMWRSVRTAYVGCFGSRPPHRLLRILLLDTRKGDYQLVPPQTQPNKIEQGPS